MMNAEMMWSDRYRSVGSDFLFGRAPNHYLEENASLFRAGQTALCLADGEGRNSCFLASLGLKVTAMDISDVAVSKALQLAQEKQVTMSTFVGDMLAIQPTEIPQQDWVIAIFIQFVAGEERLMQWDIIKKLVKPGGRVLIQGYTPKQLLYKTGGPAQEANLYTADFIRDRLSGWSEIKLSEYERVLSEGVAHSGQSALLGAIFQKPLA